MRRRNGFRKDVIPVFPRLWTKASENCRDSITVNGTFNKVQDMPENKIEEKEDMLDTVKIQQTM